MEYDYLIVGAGLFGSVFAHEATQRGFRCLVIDRRSNIGGNLFTKREHGITVHVYGPHIFHTDDESIWKYVSERTKMIETTWSPVARYGDERYSLPFNMNTFREMWGVETPDEAKRIIDLQKMEVKGEPKNLEEQAISLVGRDVYEKLVKGYTMKQWGRKCTELPPEIIKRLPVRFTYDNRYFNDKYQGIPENGYNELISKLLEGSEVKLNSDFFDKEEEYRSMAEKILYTGQIDRLFGFRFGALEYRSLDFREKTLDIEDFQGTAVVNYTGTEVPYTRIAEYKHFVGEKSDKTIIVEEHPVEWKEGMEPYYPINDESNNSRFAKYRGLADSDPQLLIGGRLGLYRYLDMDDTITECLSLCEREFGH